MKSSNKIVLTASTLVFGILLGVFLQPLISGNSVYDQSKKFADVLNLIQANYFEPADLNKLGETAISKMLEELDPHSRYITAKSMEKVNEDFQGSFDGIGVEFDIVKDTITIVTPIVGGPSEALGVQSGDKIVKIDGTSAIGLTREDVPKKLRGPKGTQVTISVLRNGNKEAIDFVITRDKIPLYSIDASFIIEGTDIGYIKMNRFAATTHDEFKAAANKLRSMGMKKMILDLQQNPGGFLDQAFKLADEFIPAGKMIVYTKGKRPEFDDDFTAIPGVGEYEKIPLIVLIDGGSASASEIVAGAIQDHDRGMIVGETSFGKGLVQRQYPLADGSAFRLTISRYYTPTGRLIQRPYDDKKNYRGSLEDLEEGMNLDHTKDADKDKRDSARPTFKTAGGRTLYGGGGITPDYIVKYDTLTMLTRNLRAKNLFWEFSQEFLQKNQSTIKTKYKDAADFARSFSLSKKDLEDFKALAVKKDVKWDEKDAKTDDETILTLLRMTIGKFTFGNEASERVFFTLNKKARVAATLFPEAQKISKLK